MLVIRRKLILQLTLFSSSPPLFDVVTIWRHAEHILMSQHFMEESGTHFPLKILECFKTYFKDCSYHALVWMHYDNNVIIVPAFTAYMKIRRTHMKIHKTLRANLDMRKNFFSRRVLMIEKKLPEVKTLPLHS